MATKWAKPYSSLKRHIFVSKDYDLELRDNIANISDLTEYERYTFGKNMLKKIIESLNANKK